MAKYLISYDLRSPGQNYDKLIEAIKDYPLWAKATESSWIVKSFDSASTLRDALKLHMDGNDRLMVVALTSEAAWSNCIASTDGIKKILTS